MTPYYQDSHVTLYHGDCREVLADIEHIDGAVIVTDPPWPISRPLIQGCDRAEALLAEALQQAEHLVPDRAVVVLGQMIDPRILSGVPARLDFFSVIWLRYAHIAHRAGAMWESDVGYVFGRPPSTKSNSTSHPTRRDEVLAWGNSRNGRQCKNKEHPCARHPDHARWLIGTWTNENEVMIDPFAGSGAFLKAAKDSDRKAIGIEIEERYCEVAVRELAQEVLAL